MIGRPQDDDILSLVRQSLPEVDDDTGSPTGAQARSVFHRVMATCASAPAASDAGWRRRNDPLRRSRRRVGLAVVVPTGAVAAAAALVATLVGSGLTSPGTPAASAETLAFRTSSALHHANESGIAFIRTVERNGKGAVISITETWGYEGAKRVEEFSAAGTPIRDISFSGSTRTGRVVDYTDRTWYTTKLPFAIAPPTGSAVVHADVSAHAQTAAAAYTYRGRLAQQLSGALPVAILVARAVALRASCSYLVPVATSSGWAPVKTGPSGSTGPTGTTSSGGETGKSGPTGQTTTSGPTGRRAPARRARPARPARPAPAVRRAPRVRAARSVSARCVCGSRAGLGLRRRVRADPPATPGRPARVRAAAPARAGPPGRAAPLAPPVARRPPRSRAPRAPREHSRRSRTPRTQPSPRTVSGSSTSGSTRRRSSRPRQPS